VGIVRRQDKNDLWKEIRFRVFDAPEGGDTFEQRLQTIQRILQKNRPPHAVAHEHDLCRDLDHLRRELARIEALGGEGLMLRQPGSKYEVGRSMTLLKVKSFHDAEARVLGHEPGKGRHQGRLGALQVELANGTRFSVGTGFSDAERGKPPPIGSTITFRYQELTDGGVPRFPSYVGIRADTPHPSMPGQAAQAKPVPVSSAGKRYFEFAKGDSSKFWEIAITGAEVTVRFGRIGSNGQTSTKNFADEAIAQKYAEKLVNEKIDKGYNEIN
jgi:DNA ligase-1